jgi:hypothetical protein
MEQDSGPGAETMPLTIFLALCFGLDIIYVLFKLFYGDKAPHHCPPGVARGMPPSGSGGLIRPAWKNASDQQEPSLPSVSRASTPEPPKRFAHNSYHTRIA